LQNGFSNTVETGTRTADEFWQVGHFGFFAARERGIELFQAGAGDVYLHQNGTTRYKLSAIHRCENFLPRRKTHLSVGAKSKRALARATFTGGGKVKSITEQIAAIEKLEALQKELPLKFQLSAADESLARHGGGR
jgi:hypothetical protein